MAIHRTLSTQLPEMSKKVRSLVVSDWAFGPPSQNSQGLTFVQISHAGAPVHYIFEGKSHFDVSSTSADGSAKTPGLQLQLSQLAEAELECMMACILHHVVENASEYGMRAEDAQQNFKPCMAKNGEFAANLRVKTASTKYWKQGCLTPAPPSHAGRLWNVKVHFKSLWFAENAWGVSCAATDMQENEVVVECPF